ncbi:MAG: hypothetical protein WCK21_01555 [Actinomycetota bacterium]
MTRDRISLTARHWSAVVAVWALGALVFFRSAIASGLDRVIGDSGDARLVALLHEHWLEVLRGNQSWRSPNFYHPATDTLGYSDTFLLDEVVYAPLRLLGFDRYAATQWTIILLSLIGFIGVYLVCTHLIGAPRWQAIGFAYIATFSNCLAVQASHLQLFAVYWVPWVVLLVAQVFNALSRRVATWWAAASGAFIGLLITSTYYIGWFTVFAGSLFGLLTLVQLREQISWRPLRHTIRNVSGRTTAFLGGFAMPMIPFALIYLPKLHETGGRTFTEVLIGAPSYGDVVNVGANNFLWGGALKAMLTDTTRLYTIEISDAVTPLVLLSVAVCAVLVAVRLRGDRSLRAATARSLLTVTIVLTVLPLRVGTFQLWHAVWRFVPGAQALRAIGRIEIMAAFTAPFAIAASLVALAAVRGDRRARPRQRWLLAALLVLLSFEQFNTQENGRIDHSDEMAFIRSVRQPPVACHSFFILNSPPRLDVEMQIDAMIAAQITGLPTINGYSGDTPPHWYLHPADPDYLDQVRLWIGLHHLERTCSYDRDTRAWDTDPLTS